MERKSCNLEYWKKRFKPKQNTKQKQKKNQTKHPITIQPILGVDKRCFKLTNIIKFCLVYFLEKVKNTVRPIKTRTFLIGSYFLGDTTTQALYTIFVYTNRVTENVCCTLAEFSVFFLIQRLYSRSWSTLQILTSV